MLALMARALRNRPLRRALLCGGIAVSALLVLVLVGVYRSSTAGIRAYVGQARIDL